MDDGELGRRIAYWRERRGMTQQLFADRIGRSHSWVAKVETGARSAERLSVLERVTAVLRIDLQVLIGRGLPRDSERCIDNVEVEGIRAALERYDGIATVSGTDGSDPPSLAHLQRQTSYVWSAFELTNYEVIGRTLPRLLAEAQRAHAAYGETESARLLAEVYQLTASTLRKLGEFDLAWLAGDRGLPLARETGDVLLTATGAFRIANALLAVGRIRAAFDLNMSFADRVETAVASPAASSVYGTMLLQAAMAAAHKGENRTVRDVLREAQAVADRLGEGRNDYRTAFGPVNVGIHRVAAFVALGEGGTAVEAATTVDAEGLRRLRRERQADHLVDVARGHSQWGQRGEALTYLLRAERLAAPEVRCRPVARSTITDLVRRAHPSPPRPLTQLAERAGIAA